MAIPLLGAAVPRLGQLAIRTDAGLGERAPEQAFIGARHRLIGLRPDVETLGVQVRTHSRTIAIKTMMLAHAMPPLPKGSATLRCFALAMRSRATALTSAHPPSESR